MRMFELPMNFKPIINVVILNGPRGSGKDYLAGHMASARDVSHVKFSAMLKTVVADGLNITYDKLEQIKTTKAFGPNGDMSYVDLQIDLFNYLEKMYGPAVLGNCLINEIRYTTEEHETLPIHTFIVSDGGRGAEIQSVIDEFGPEHVLLVRLHREGHTFDGDIRSYITNGSVTNIDITNSGGPDFVPDAIKIIGEWANKISNKALEAQGGAVHETNKH